MGPVLRWSEAVSGTWLRCLTCVLAATQAPGQLEVEKELPLPTAAQIQQLRRHTVVAKVLQRIEREHARAAQEIGRARTLLTRGDLVAATEHLHAARLAQEEVRGGDAWIRRLVRDHGVIQHMAVIEDLSFVRARVVKARRDLQVDLSELPAKDRALIRVLNRVALGILGRVLGGPTSFDEVVLQEIGARIAEIHTVGSRYARKTLWGKRFPFQKRRDLTPGATVELHYWKLKKGSIRELREGREYWLVLTPPLALKDPPRIAGQSGRTWIDLALRAAPRRRL